MNIHYITSIALCCTLAACSDSGTSPPNDGSTQPTLPTSTQPTSTQPTSTQPTQPINSTSEDQLLNQGTSQAPGTAWACSIPNDSDFAVLGFYGQGDGIIGALEPSGAITGTQAPYVFDASGNATFTVQVESGPLAIVLAAPNFIDGTNFTSGLTVGNEPRFETNCELFGLTAAGGGSEPETGPTTGGGSGGDLESRLLNSGTQANPAGGWSCEGLLLGFYGAGQGRIGQSDGNGGGSFNTMEYSIVGADELEIFANGVTGTMSSFQFSGPDNFSTVVFDGSDTLGLDCTRQQFELASASAESRTTDLSKLKSALSAKGLIAEQLPKL